MRQCLSYERSTFRNAEQASLFLGGNCSRLNCSAGPDLRCVMQRDADHVRCLELVLKIKHKGMSFSEFEQLCQSLAGVRLPITCACLESGACSCMVQPDCTPICKPAVMQAVSAWQVLWWRPEPLTTTTGTLWAACLSAMFRCDEASHATAGPTEPWQS